MSFDDTTPENAGGTSSHVGTSARRLAAILSADIKDFSRLMGADEEGTLARIKRYRREIVDPTIVEHHGKVIKNTGDGFLAIFDSPLEAVRCAIVIQQSLVGRNASLPKQAWMRYRMGVNLGDVLIDPDDIYGDGVNIAARLQTMADPGGVFISGGVYEQIKNKLVCGYQSLGDERLKNITDPVRIYRVLPDLDAVADAKMRNRIRAAIAACVLVVASIVGWYTLRPGTFTQAEEPRAVPQQQAAAPVTPPQQQAAARATPPEPPRSSEPRATPVAAAAAASAPAGRDRTVAPAGRGSAAASRPSGRGQAAAPSRAGRQRSLSRLRPMPGTGQSSRRHLHHGQQRGADGEAGSSGRVEPFALGRFPVTIGEWKQCVAAKACNYQPTGDDDMPVYNVSWNDAQQYLAWLSNLTNRKYRLPSEAEWEYAARAGANTKYWWGDQLVAGMANCKDCGDTSDQRRPMKTASFVPNPFGLYDMTGGVSQWVADCWHKDYQGAPRRRLGLGRAELPRAGFARRLVAQRCQLFAGCQPQPL